MTTGRINQVSIVQLKSSQAKLARHAPKVATGSSKPRSSTTRQLAPRAGSRPHREQTPHSCPIIISHTHNLTRRRTTPQNTTHRSNASTHIASQRENNAGLLASAAAHHHQRSTGHKAPSRRLRRPQRDNKSIRHDLASSLKPLRRRQRKHAAAPLDSATLRLHAKQAPAPRLLSGSPLPPSRSLQLNY